MAEADAQQVALDPDDTPLTALPEELECLLRRARHLHKRAMRARYDSNERSTMLEESREYIGFAMAEAATEGVALNQLPEWARQAYK